MIGNNRCSNLPDNRQLTSPVADATDVAAALKKLGYTIVTGAAVTDASKDAMLNATEAFATAAKDAEGAVFYYSGHGVQVGEDNYLLPSDAPHLTGISVLKNRTVLLRDTVMVALEEARAKNKVIILDCCRDNPFAAQLETALAQVGKSVKTKNVGEITGYGPGFYLAFATSPTQEALDGNGARNSPFTAAMLWTLLASAEKEIDLFFREVKGLLPEEQVSWTSHSCKGTQSFAFAPGFPGPQMTSDQKPRPVGEVVRVLPGSSTPRPNEVHSRLATWSRGTLKADLVALALHSLTEASATVRIKNASPDKAVKIAFDWSRPERFSASPPPGSVLNTAAGATLICTGSSGIIPLNYAEAANGRGVLGTAQDVIGEATDLGPEEEIAVTLKFGLSSASRGFALSTDRDSPPPSKHPAAASATHSLSIGFWQAEVKGESFGRPVRVNVLFHDIPQEQLP